MALAEKIAAPYGEHPVRRGRDILVRCVIHENDGDHHNPSLALWLRPDGSIGMFCQSLNCPYRAIVAELRRRGIVIGRPSNALAVAATVSEEDRREVSLLRARDILQQASRLDDGSEAALCVQKYLKLRGLDLDANERGFLRWVWSDRRREVSWSAQSSISRHFATCPRLWASRRCRYRVAAKRYSTATDARCARFSADCAAAASPSAWSANT